MADDFIATYAPLANDIATRTGVDPSVVLGIIDTETGHGVHVLGNNIFGITPPGGVARYPDVQTAANAFITLMQTPRYRGVAAAADPASQAAALVKGGYNTVNPQYASIVANKALNIGKQLGYQDGSGGAPSGPAVYSTSSQPVATPDASQPTATSYSDSPAPAAAPQQPSQPPATTGSAKDRVLRDPALGGGNGSSTTPAAGQSAKDRVLADPALKTTETTTTTQETAPAQDPYSGAPTSDDYQPSPAVTGALSRVGQAAAEGSAEGPHIPRVPGNLVMSAVYNPLIAGAETALRGVNALGRGAAQAIYEAGEPLGRALPEISIPENPVSPVGQWLKQHGISGTILGGPGLGRDLNLLAQVAPVAQAEGGIMRSAMQPPVAPEVNALRPAFVSERFAPPRQPGMTDAERIQQLIRHDEAESAGAGPETQAGASPGFRPNVDPTKPFTYNPPSSGWPAGTEAWAENRAAAAPAAAPLSAEDQRWIAGTQVRLDEINQANRAAGVPGSLGAAATPEELAQLTPAQMKAYRRQAELGEILAPPVRGLDRSIYVEGSEPTRAEYSGDPAISQQESLHRERDPNSFDPRLNANTQARVNSYENMMGTDPQIVDLKEGKSAAAEKDGAAYIQAARPLDMQPQLEWLNGKLADPRIQERPEVRDVLTKLRDSLFDENGQLKTDPRAGWGMHDNMINRLDKAGDRTSAERYAITQLKEYKDIVDGVNNTASDGAFQTFLDNQSHYAQQINSMEELQKFRPRFTNTKGEINANAFHKFVTDLAIRRGRPGVDPAMDISDETMRGLINIDKDLKRATNIDLGKARGSNTNLLFTLAQAAGLGAAHLGVAAMTHGAPTANLFLQGALNQAGRMTGNVLLRRAVRRGLAPPPGGYDYNPLQQGPPP